jgi:hypothetical protein
LVAGQSVEFSDAAQRQESFDFVALRVRILRGGADRTVGDGPLPG